MYIANITPSPTLVVSSKISARLQIMHQNLHNLVCLTAATSLGTLIGLQRQHQ